MSRNVSARIRGVRPDRVQLASAALAAGLLFMLGCEGENIFAEDRDAPDVEIIEPLLGDNVAPDDSVIVRASLSDGRGVVHVTMEGIAQRTDPVTGAVEQVARLEAREFTFARPVRDTVMEEYLRTTGDTGLEPVLLMVTATDEAGNVGADTVEVTVAGPQVSVRNPTAGQTVRAGMEVPVEIVASDPSGVNFIAVTFDGVVQETRQFAFAAVMDTVLRTTLALPATVGELTVTARASNTAGVMNRSSTIRVEVASAAEADNVPPRTALEVADLERAELTDSMRIVVRARDNDGGTGVASVGYTVLATSLGGGADMALHRSHTFSTPRPDLAEHEFVLAVESIYAIIGDQYTAGLSLPDTLRLEFHAVAHDAAGNCAAATGSSLTQMPCGQVTRAGTTVPVAENAIGRRAETIVVGGRTIALPAGGVIADAAVDHQRRQLFLSNFTFNRVEKLDLQTLNFHPGGIQVGSQPWGLFMDNSGDSLIVANSGGTNLDFVPLGPTGLPVGPNDRLQTPNVLLFQVRQQEDEGSAVRYTSTAIDFSDRPQFVAQDVEGSLLYSTVPTAAASDGTIRRAWRQPGWTRWEVELLLIDWVTENPDAFAIAKADSVFACTVTGTGGGSSGILIYDRVPGTNNHIWSNCEHPVDAVANVRSQGSDVTMRERVEWDLGRIGLSDTTFVAASGNRRRIVFGEGAEEHGRIMMWYAEEERSSNAIEVIDLIHNEPARITGVDLNQDGQLGVARGAEGAYYFSEDLRLVGRAVEGVGGGAGAGLHPSHSGQGAGLSFVGTNRNSIQVIDVVHFTTRGEIPIRDQVVGPLKVSLPLPGDPADTVVRIYAVTDGGGVVLVRVRESDITP